MILTVTLNIWVRRDRSRGSLGGTLKDSVKEIIGLVSSCQLPQKNCALNFAVAISIADDISPGLIAIRAIDVGLITDAATV